MQPAMPTSCCYRDCSLCCITLCDELFRSVTDLELDGDLCSLNKFMTVIVLCDSNNHAVESLHSCCSEQACLEGADLHSTHLPFIG